MLETVIPRAEPGVVMILSGKNKGMVSRNSFQSLIKSCFFFGKIFFVFIFFSLQFLWSWEVTIELVRVWITVSTITQLLYSSDCLYLVSVQTNITE